MGRPSKTAEFQLWDWTKQDIALAELYGVTRERVRQIRRALGRNDSYNKRRKRKALPFPSAKHVVV